MSVAPDIAPEVTIPARARRTSLAWWPESTVIGNVITPSAFHRPVQDDGGADGGADGWGLGRSDTALRLVPALRPSAVPEAEPGLRLTMRGRLAITLVTLAVSLTIAGVAWSSWPSSSRPPVVAAAPAQIVVHDGDTLWSIAAVVAPTRDPRQTVDRLRRINGLTSVILVPGQVLRTR